MWRVTILIIRYEQPLFNSRLFQNDVDDKLIKGVTGHRSDALQGYKRETEDQLLKFRKLYKGKKRKKAQLRETLIQR